jgi:heme exporter protein D
MSYLPYIIAAYSVFGVVLAWDGLAPWLKHRRLLRAIRRKAARKHDAQGRANAAGAGSAGAAK